MLAFGFVSLNNLPMLLLFYTPLIIHTDICTLIRTKFFHSAIFQRQLYSKFGYNSQITES